ncbi:MAG: hypothetical protein M3P11_12690 [Actinomycetota bacterium]|nr:hypothetical protein [Actinomycetota bacterium]
MDDSQTTSVRLGASGKEVKELLRKHRVDAAWPKELLELRSLLRESYALRR